MDRSSVARAASNATTSTPPDSVLEHSRAEGREFESLKSRHNTLVAKFSGFEHRGIRQPGQRCCMNKPEYGRFESQAFPPLTPRESISIADGGASPSSSKNPLSVVLLVHARSRAEM